MSLFLIGPRGSGKSSAGAQAARLLGVPFVDSDQRVESRAGLVIAEIFASEGEQAFRRLEREVMLELMDQQGLMVSTGGGCVLDSEVRQRLRETNVVLWLTAALETLQRRIAGSDRPSLTGSDPADELADLLRAREPLYRQCATRCLDTSDLSIEEVALGIQRFWTSLPHHNLR
jgi:shikimate kinase